MAVEPIEIRMAKLEGGYQQIDHRLGMIEQRIGALENRMTAELTDLRRQITTQFYWLLTFVLGSILVPLLRDLTARL